MGPGVMKGEHIKSSVRAEQTAALHFNSTGCVERRVFFEADGDAEQVAGAVVHASATAVEVAGMRSPPVRLRHHARRRCWFWRQHIPSGGRGDECQSAQPSPAMSDMPYWQQHACGDSSPRSPASSSNRGGLCYVSELRSHPCAAPGAGEDQAGACAADQHDGPAGAAAAGAPPGGGRPRQCRLPDRVRPSLL